MSPFSLTRMLIPQPSVAVATGEESSFMTRVQTSFIIVLMFALAPLDGRRVKFYRYEVFCSVHTNH